MENLDESINDFSTYIESICIRGRPVRGRRHGVPF